MNSILKRLVRQAVTATPTSAELLATCSDASMIREDRSG
jgi:hypothetical protein